MIRVWLSLWVITGLICKLNAAAIKDGKSIDLNETAVNSDDEKTASTYNHSQEHLTMNNSKVVIDLFTPTSRPSTDSKSNDEHTDKKTTPIVQLVINKANVIDNADNTTTSASNKTISTSTTTPSPTTQHSTTTVAHSPLIPPASVNASIKHSDKEPKSKQGQIIIRYAYNFDCFASFSFPHTFPFTFVFLQMHFNFVHDHVELITCQ